MIQEPLFVEPKIEVVPLIDCLANPIIAGYLRGLTNHRRSGMNVLMDAFQETKPVNARAILASVDGKIIGWGLLAYNVDKYCWEHFDRGDDGVIIQVYVDRAYRRKGVGSAIFFAAQKEVAGKKLGVSKHSWEAEQFFDSVRKAIV